MGQRQLTATDGFVLGAYEALPAGTAKGAVVVIQEIFGVNHHIRAVADSYAREGYVAIAPQLFDRAERNIELGYTDPAEIQQGIKLAFQDLEMAETLLDLQAAIDAGATHGKVGVVGYCYGGLMTWLAACELNGVAAAAAYYGGGIVKETARTPRCPVIMHYGERDQHIPISDVERIHKAQPTVQIFIYQADHGFNCDERASYDAVSAKLARQRTLAFFAEHL